MVQPKDRVKPTALPFDDGTFVVDVVQDKSFQAYTKYREQEDFVDVEELEAATSNKC